MDTTKIISVLVSVLGALASSGPWGVAALAIGMLASGLGVNYYINKLNKKTDAKDQDNAGLDAGETAAILQNQTRMTADKLQEVGNANPATEEK